MRSQLRYRPILTVFQSKKLRKTVFLDIRFLREKSEIPDEKLEGKIGPVMEVHMDANRTLSQLCYRPIWLICLQRKAAKPALQSRAEKKPDRQAIIYRRRSKTAASHTVEQSPNYYSMVLDNCKRYFFEISKSYIDNPGKMMYDNKVSAFPARTSRRPGARPH